MLFDDTFDALCETWSERSKIFYYLLSLSAIAGVGHSEAAPWATVQGQTGAERLSGK